MTNQGANILMDSRSTRIFRKIVLFFLMMCGAACTGFKSPTYATLTLIVSAADEARMQLPDKCDVAQMAEVAKAKSADEAQANVKVIQKRCDSALAATEAVVKTVKAARDGIYDLTVALKDPKSVLVWANAALDAWKNLRDLLAIIGIQTPIIPGAE